MKKILVLVYGTIAYLLFLVTFLYTIGFVGNLIVPKTIDGDPQVSLTKAIIINAFLLLLFALQHSIMARQAFKKWWTKIIPASIERSTFVLFTCFCLLLMMWQWQPIGGVIWAVDNSVIKIVLTVLFFSGWTIVLISSFMINHFDLFGLRQVWLFFSGKRYEHLLFRVPLFYRYVRHPLYFGFLLAFWCTPVMTAAHLLFAVLTTGYILTAIQFEEKDLVSVFGIKYQEYRKRLPMIIPFMKKNISNK